jgi:hypothetical protein
VSPHRAKGSWTPRLAGIAVIVVVAGGALGVYLSTAHAPHQAPVASHHHQPRLSVKVVQVQTVGVIDFGPDDNGRPWQGNPADHPLMLRPAGKVLDFVMIPRRKLSSGPPEWTADQMADGSEIFIYVPTGQCLSPLGAGQLQLTHCNLSLAQRWRPVHSQMVLGEAIAQYADAKTGTCLTAQKYPAPAVLSKCGGARTRTQEIAFWWSA